MPAEEVGVQVVHSLGRYETPPRNWENRAVPELHENFRGVCGLSSLYGSGVELGVRVVGNQISIEIFNITGLLREELDKGISPFHYQLADGLSPLVEDLRRTVPTREVIRRLSNFWYGFYKKAISRADGIDENGYQSLLREFQGQAFQIETLDQYTWVEDLIMGIAVNHALKRIIEENLIDASGDRDYLVREHKLLRVLYAAAKFHENNPSFLYSGLELGRVWLWSCLLFDEAYSEGTYLPYPHFWQRRCDLPGFEGDRIVFPMDSLDEVRRGWRIAYEDSLRAWHKVMGVPVSFVDVVGGIPGCGKSTIAAALVRIAELRDQEFRFGEVWGVKTQETVGLKAALSPLLDLMGQTSISYELYARVTGLASLIARALAEVTLEKLVTPELSYFVFQTWTEVSLVGRVTQDHSGGIWLFIQNLFGKDFLNNLFESLRSDVVVDIPEKIRWYVEGLFSEYPNEIHDLTSYPVGSFSMIDIPTDLAVEAIQADHSQEGISLRRQKYLDDPFIMPTLRLVANVFARTFHFPIQPACVVRSGKVERLSPLELSWGIIRRNSYLSVAKHVSDTVLGISRKSISNELDSLLQLNAKMQCIVEAFEIEMLRKYRSYTEIQELLRLLAEKRSHL